MRARPAANAMCAIRRARCCGVFRHATAAERDLAQRVVDELRPLDYLAAGSLQRKLELVGRISRGEFDALLDAMTRCGLIGIEEAEFEKNGEVIHFRKIRLTEDELAVRRSRRCRCSSAMELERNLRSRASAPRRRRRRSRNLRKTARPQIPDLCCRLRRTSWRRC